MKILGLLEKSILKNNSHIILSVGFIAILLFSCTQKNNLFELKNAKALLKIADSINKTKYNSQIKIPLTFYEKMNSHYFYREFSTIFENENFKAIIILSQKRKDNFYHFLVRTINKNNNKIIGTFLLASYNENTKEFCSGYISTNLKVSRTCKDINFTLEKQIDNFGNIIPLKN